MNNNFFKNLGIGRQTFVKKWVETSDTTDLQYDRIKLNEDLNFSVIKNPELVLGNIIYHIIKKKDLPDCIVYDFNKFSKLHIGDVNYFKRSNCLHDVNYIDDWIELLNIIDDHIINLTEISFIESVLDSSDCNKVIIFKKHENNDWRILL